MSAWKVAAGLVTLKKQLDAAYPGRDRRSDGSIGDRAHQARQSDHNPNARGFVCAMDFDEDLDLKSKQKSEALMRRFADDINAYAASGLPGSERVKYLIYENAISSGTHRATWWRFRKGSFGHTIHLHLSVTQAAEKDGQPWPLPFFGFPPFDEQAKARKAAAKPAAKPAVRPAVKKAAPAKKTAAKKA